MTAAYTGGIQEVRILEEKQVFKMLCCYNTITVFILNIGVVRKVIHSKNLSAKLKFQIWLPSFY